MMHRFNVSGKKEANQHTDKKNEVFLTRNCVVEYAVYVRYTYRHAPLCTIPPTCVVDQQLRLDLEAYWFFDKGRRHIDASKEYMHELGEKKSVWSSFCYAYNTHGAREGDTESLTFTICAVQPYTTAAIQTLSLVLTPCSVQECQRSRCQLQVVSMSELLSLLNAAGFRL
jgi:hypothetical protein